METINKSKLFKRAWYLTKNQFGSFSFNLKKVWKELKQAVKDAINALIVIETEKQPLYSNGYKATNETLENFYRSNCYKGD